MMPVRKKDASRRRKEAGFSLVELMVVIFIWACLRPS